MLDALDILLVEDNPVNQKVALRVLEQMGHRVSLATNGAEAVRMTAERLVPDRADGCADAGHGRTGRHAGRYAGAKMQTHLHQKILAMTANAMQGDRERCLQAGMDGYVSKPVDRQGLMAEIKRVLDSALTVECVTALTAGVDAGRGLARYRHERQPGAAGRRP
jgi:two-component system sensor histidine kinase/response regulator